MKSRKRQKHRQNQRLINTRAGRKTRKSKLNCSPKPKSEMNDFSCYSNKSLFLLRDKWNARHEDAKIESDSPKEIHEKLTEYNKHICSNEKCWLKMKKNFGKLESELNESFAPDAPAEWKKNPNEWLSSVDITRVMKQYEKAYKCFDFIGPSPIDFDKKKLHGECVWEELCNFDPQKCIKRGKNKIGIIFNTDPHDKPGQHWISMFINFNTNHIFFFDSTGDAPPKEIKKFVKRIQQQCAQQLSPPKKMIYDSNEGIEHQYGNTECGVYSLYFIIHMLEDKVTEHYLKTHILKDEYIEKYRHVFFN